MTLTRLDKFPAPYFGGKGDAAGLIWQALGDPSHFCEPFCGSLVTLLRRPHPCNRTYYSETVNDLDGLLVNAIRSLAYSPDETAEAASWPVAEADLHARQLALVRWRDAGDLERLMADPFWHDPQMGGWWLWGSSCWIGGGWAAGDGPWIAGDDGRLTRRSNGEPGVSGGGPERWLDTVAADYAASEGYHPMTMPELRRWFAWLSARIRHVRILNGDWTRLCTSGALKTLPVWQGKGVAGIFLDPPYGAAAGRADVYAHESGTVAGEVRAWCLANGSDPQYRIVLAGFAGEGHEELEAHGWRAVEWFAAGFLKGGMGVQSADGHQQHRERLWLSPHCCQPAAVARAEQGALWEVA